MRTLICDLLWLPGGSDACLSVSFSPHLALAAVLAMAERSSGVRTDALALPPWAANRLTLKLRSFGRLQPGWHFGEGVPVSIIARHVAETFLEWGRQLDLPMDVFPGTDGECMVAFYGTQETVRIIITPDDKHGTKLGLRVERGRGFRYVDVIEPAEDVLPRVVFGEILKLAKADNVWKSRERYTSSDILLVAFVVLDVILAVIWLLVTLIETYRT